MLLATRRRFTATIVVCAVLTFTIVGPVTASDDGAIFSGKVYKETAANPEAGVVVTLVGSTIEQSYRSSPSTGDGTFRVEGAPAGSYRVVAETSRGAFLAGAPVDLAPGNNRPVALTLGGDSPDFQTTAGTTAGGSGGLPSWAKWTIVGGIAVIALFAIDQVVNDDDKELPSSP